MVQVLDIELNIIVMYITRQITVDQHFAVTAKNLRSINVLGVNKLFALHYKDGTIVILRQDEVRDFILYELSKENLNAAKRAYKAFKDLV
jgi:hypothetical protein